MPPGQQPPTIVVLGGDEPLAAVRRAAQEAGERWRVVAAGRADDARRALESTPFAAVLASLPAGEEIVETIRGAAPEAAILVVARDDELGRAAVRAGADDYLTECELAAPALRRALSFTLQLQQRRQQLYRVTAQARAAADVRPLESPRGVLGPTGDGGVRRDTGGHRSCRHFACSVTAEHGLHRILALHEQGASPATIAAALNSQGYRTPAGTRWHVKTVARVVAAHDGSG